jgi:hypothetical protein
VFCPRFTGPNEAFRDQAEKATCDGGEVCCHLSNFEVFEEECGESDGEFSCTPKSECFDDAFPDNVKNSRLRFGYCRGFNDVCCKHKKPEEEVDQNDCTSIRGYKCRSLPTCKLTEPVRKSENNRLFTVSATDGCKSGTVSLDNTINKCEKQDEICCKGTRPDDPRDPREPDILPACGRHNPNGLGLKSMEPIDKERSTQFGEWPFTCLVYGKDESLLGGASLIAPGIALTAVHILESNSLGDIKVRCGEWDISRKTINTRFNTEALRAQERDVKSISAHPQFHNRQLYHDMALLHTAEDFDLDEHLNTICLPGKPFKDAENFKSSGCVVTGWGKRAERDPADREESAQPIMKAVKNLPIVENDKCEQALQEVNSRFRLHDSFTCAGGERGIDACEGDGGGPLACPNPTEEDRYVLAGVVVGGVGCGQDGLAGAYASVEYDLCFIHWATKCRAGQTYRDFYWYPECDDWLEREKPNMRRRQKALAEQLESECTPAQ